MITQDIRSLLGADAAEPQDELHVYLDVGVSADARGSGALCDLYSPTGVRDFTQPIRACVHVIIGQCTQLVVGQRRGPKCCYKSGSAE